MCVDQDRLLYHFLVEGTVIKDGSKVQCDVSAVAVLSWRFYFETDCCYSKWLYLNGCNI